MGNPFSAIVRPQTYVNALYLLLSFPLGIAYFVCSLTHCLILRRRSVQRSDCSLERGVRPKHTFQTG